MGHADLAVVVQGEAIVMWLCFLVEWLEMPLIAEPIVKNEGSRVGMF